MYTKTERDTPGNGYYRPGVDGEGETTPALEEFRFPREYNDKESGQWTGRLSGDEVTRLLQHNGSTLNLESLGDPLDDDLENYKSGCLKRRSWRNGCTLNRMFKWVAGLLLILILILFFGSLANSPSPEETKKEETQDVVPLPGSSAQPQETKGASKNEFPIRWPRRCKSDYETNSVDFDFGSTADLQIRENISESSPYKRVFGWIHIAKAPEDQTSPIRASLSYAISNSVASNPITYSTSSNELIITSPSLPSSTKPSGCLGVSTTIYMKPGTSLSSLTVIAQTLGLQIHSGSSFSISNTTTISLASGGLDAAFFPSRETRIETTAGSISGLYALSDLLSFKTISGSLSLTIAPQPASQFRQIVPAVFTASSLSGSIRADYETKDLPDRDYRISLSTNVGTIAGSLVHGSSTIISSIAGLVSVSLLPYIRLSSSAPSILSTTSDSGKQEIEILEPVKGENVTGRLDRLSSSHQTISGAMELGYPEGWEGRLEGRSGSGGIHLWGDGLVVEKKEVSEAGESKVVARKGGDGGKESGSSLRFDSLSGGCDVRVGRGDSGKRKAKGRRVM